MINSTASLSGGCFIDPEKLFALSKCFNRDGQMANIHWIITGKGEPLLKEDCEGAKDINALLKKVSSLPPEKKNALSKLLK